MGLTAYWFVDNGDGKGYSFAKKEEINEIMRTTFMSVGDSYKCLTPCIRIATDVPFATMETRDIIDIVWNTEAAKYRASLGDTLAVLKKAYELHLLELNKVKIDECLDTNMSDTKDRMNAELAKTQPEPAGLHYCSFTSEPDGRLTFQSQGKLPMVEHGFDYFTSSIIVIGSKELLDCDLGDIIKVYTGGEVVFFYGFGFFKGQCTAEVLRYLKEVYVKTKPNGEQEVVDKAMPFVDFVNNTLTDFFNSLTMCINKALRDVEIQFHLFHVDAKKGIVAYIDTFSDINSLREGWEKYRDVGGLMVKLVVINCGNTCGLILRAFPDQEVSKNDEWFFNKTTSSASETYRRYDVIISESINEDDAYFELELSHSFIVVKRKESDWLQKALKTRTDYVLIPSNAIICRKSDSGTDVHFCSESIPSIIGGPISKVKIEELIVKANDSGLFENGVSLSIPITALKDN